MACKEVSAPANDVFLITPNNDSDLGTFTRGISFAVAGALHIKDANGAEVTIPSGALAAGIIHPVRIRRVYSTDTTATDIVGYA